MIKYHVLSFRKKRNLLCSNDVGEVLEFKERLLASYENSYTKALFLKKLRLFDEDEIKEIIELGLDTCLCIEDISGVISSNIELSRFEYTLSDFEKIEKEYSFIKKHEFEIGGKNFVSFLYTHSFKKFYTYPPIVQECRGITFNSDTKEIVCLPFKKFYNIEENEDNEKSQFFWNSVSGVFEKRDGFLIYPILVSDKLYFKTGVSPYTEEAKYFNDWFKKKYSEKSDLYKVIVDCIKNKMTPLFEFESFKYCGIVRPKKEGLYFLAIRNMFSGETIVNDKNKFYERVSSAIGLENCSKKIDISQEKDVYSFLRKQTSDLTDSEGFVVHFHDGRMLKMKSEWWLFCRAWFRNRSTKRLINIYFNPSKCVEWFPSKILHMRGYKNEKKMLDKLSSTIESLIIDPIYNKIYHLNCRVENMNKRDAAEIIKKFHESNYMDPFNNIVFGGAFIKQKNCNCGETEIKEYIRERISKNKVYRQKIEQLIDVLI